MTEAEWEDLEPEIREYEPRDALVAGTTGLEAIEALAEELFGLAPRPAVVALEVGADQAERGLEAGLRGRLRGGRSTPRPAGHDRVVIGR